MLVSKTQLSDLTGISPRTLTRKLDGVKFKSGPRNSQLYDSRDVLARLYGASDEDDTPSYDSERTRLTRAQADHEELKVQTLEATLIPADTVEQTWMDMALSMRAKLLGLPTRIAPKVMAATSLRDVEEFARQEIYAALDELSGHREPDQSEGSGGDEIAAASDGQRVGAN